MFFESEFTLNRQHLEESYDQSQPFSKHQKPRVKFIVLLLVVALLIFNFTSAQDVLAYFAIALAVLEYLSFRYRRAWWLLRQVWSKNSGNIINMKIDDEGIKIKSVYINTQLLWTDIIKVNTTEKGLMLTLKNGSKNYLSNSTLNAEVIDFIKKLNSSSAEQSV